MNKEIFEAQLREIKAVFPNTLIPLKEAVEFCGLDYGAIVRAPRKAGGFPKQKIGGRWFVSAVKLAQFLS